MVFVVRKKFNKNQRKHTESVREEEMDRFVFVQQERCSIDDYAHITRTHLASEDQNTGMLFSLLLESISITKISCFVRLARLYNEHERKNHLKKMFEQKKWKIDNDKSKAIARQPYKCFTFVVVTTCFLHIRWI